MGTGKERLRRAIATLGAAAALGAAFPAATALGSPDPPDGAGVTITARVGAEIGVRLGPDGSVHDASTVATRVVRERRGDVVVITVV